MKNPIFTKDALQTILNTSTTTVLHKFDSGTLHNLNLSTEDDTLQDKFIEYNTSKDKGTVEELERDLDDTYNSDISFLQKYFPDQVSIKRLIVNEVDGSVLSIYLISCNNYHWTLYSVDGMEFHDVLFKSEDIDEVLDIIIWLYLSDRKPDEYRKVANFLNPDPDNIEGTRLKLHQSLDTDLSRKLINKSPLSPSFFP